jgi:hypothetical protein
MFFNLTKQTFKIYFIFFYFCILFLTVFVNFISPSSFEFKLRLCERRAKILYRFLPLFNLQKEICCNFNWNIPICFCLNIPVYMYTIFQFYLGIHENDKKKMIVSGKRQRFFFFRESKSI